MELIHSFFSLPPSLLLAFAVSGVLGICIGLVSGAYFMMRLVNKRDVRDMTLARKFPANGKAL